MFDLYHGEQVGEGNKSLALRLEFRAPDRTLTDEEVAERRAAIERALESIGGRAPCLTASPSSAPPGYGGAVAAAILRRHPSLELTARHRALGRRAAATTSSTRATACRLELEEFDARRDRRARRIAPSWPTRTAPPRPR